jgi:hypothetical protein
MNLRVLIGLLAMLAWGCSPVREATSTSAILTQSSQDSTEYEILIIDIHFDLWYQTHFSPAKDRTNEFYQYKNRVAVEAWNYDYLTGRYTGVIDCYIDYRPDIDYGMEVNRKLYWYFRYIADEYGVRLL